MSQEQRTLLLLELVRARHDNRDGKIGPAIWQAVEAGEDWMPDLLGIAEIAIVFLERHLNETVPGLRGYLDQLENDVRFAAMTNQWQTPGEEPTEPTTGDDHVSP